MNFIFSGEPTTFRRSGRWWHVVFRIYCLLCSCCWCRITVFDDYMSVVVIVKSCWKILVEHSWGAHDVHLCSWFFCVFDPKMQRKKDENVFLGLLCGCYVSGSE